MFGFNNKAKKIALDDYDGHIQEKSNLCVGRNGSCYIGERRTEWEEELTKGPVEKLADNLLEKYPTAFPWLSVGILVGGFMYVLENYSDYAIPAGGYSVVGGAIGLFSSKMLGYSDAKQFKAMSYGFAIGAAFGLGQAYQNIQQKRQAEKELYGDFYRLKQAPPSVFIKENKQLFQTSLPKAEILKLPGLKCS